VLVSLSCTVRSFFGVFLFLCALAASLQGDDFNDAFTRASKALEKGACKEAGAIVKPVLEMAQQRVGTVEPAQQIRGAILLAETQVCIGFYREALDLAKLKSQSQALPPELVASILLVCAEAEKGQGQYADAENDYAAAAAIRLPASPEADRWLMRFLTGWSELSRLRGDFPKAETQLKEAFSHLDKGPHDSIERAYGLLIAGDLARDRELFTEARERYNEARSISESRSKEHPVAARASLGLGLLALTSGGLDVADAELKRADAASRRVTSSDAFLESSDALGLLDVAKGNLVLAETNLQRTLDYKTRSRGDQHPATARSLDHLGMAYLAERKPDRAIEALRRAEAIQRLVLGPEHPDLAITLMNLGRAYRMQGKSVEAKDALDQALAIQTAKLGRNSVAGASTRFEQANMLVDENNPRQAEALYRDALSTQESLLSKDSRLRVATLRELALVLHRQGKGREAEALIQDWMKLRGDLPVLHPERLPLAIAQAEISLEVRKFPEAEKQFSEILSANEKLGKAAQRLYPAQKGFADALFAQEKWKEAARVYEIALPNLAGQRAVYSGWINLAKCRSVQKQWAESLHALSRALESAKKSGVPESEQQAILFALLETSSESGQSDLLSLYAAQWLSSNRSRGSTLSIDQVKIIEKAAQKLLVAQQYSTAELLFRFLADGGGGKAIPGVNMNDVLAELSQACVAQNKNLEAADAYERLANRMTAGHRLPDSEKFLLKALELREKDKSPDSLKTVSTMQALAGVYIRERKYADARPLYERARSLLETRGLSDDSRNAVNLNGLGMIALAGKNTEAAESLFNQARAVLSAAAKPSEAALASVLFNIGSLKMSMGKDKEATDAFQRCLQLSTARYTEDDPPPVDEFDQIASAYGRQGKFDEAEKLYQSNRKLRHDFFGENSTDEGWGLNSLAVFYNSRKMYDKAAESGERALHIFETNVGPESHEAGIALAQLATAHQGSGDIEKAIAATDRAAQIQEKLGLPRAEVSITLSTLAEYYSNQKDYQRALKIYTKLAKLWQSDSSSSLNYQLAVKNLAVTYVYLKDFKTGQDWYRKLHAALQNDPIQQMKAAEAFADALRSNRREQDARKVMDQVEGERRVTPRR
jgi:tetratricopeptide (TPR) repeat protein